MRLIDADALQEEHVRLSGRELSLIEDAPTVDAVKVVRCRDCKWYHNANDKYFPRTCDHWSEMFSHYEDWESVDENGFCSWGERKDEVT